MIKWAGALAAVGVVGVGLGFGGDLLIRPNVTSTTTATGQGTGSVTTVTGPTTTVTCPTTTVTGPTTTVKGSTVTVTSPPTTLGYVPPLSSAVQNRVTQLMNDAVALHNGETTFYKPASRMDVGDLLVCSRQRYRMVSW